MPAARQPLSVPKFTKTEIERANKCAILLWNGVSYIDGKAIVSDRDFYIYFNTTLKSVLKAKSTFNPKTLHDLIITCHLKAMLRTQHQLSYPKMEQWLRNNYSKNTKLSRLKGLKRTEKRRISGNRLVLGVGKSVVKSGVSVSAGFRVPFSSRLLFFACPNLLIFNFANPLAVEKMHFQARPQVAYPFFSSAMLDGLRLNWIYLSLFNVPRNSSVREPAVDRLRKTDWWARRVLDLALIIRLGVFQVNHAILRLVRHQRFKDQTKALCKCP